jgi:hypothetical protein
MCTEQDARRAPLPGSPLMTTSGLETARHNGHIDILRETADGATGM